MQETTLERLDFTIPDFLRISWVSELAREYWEPKITAISQLWPFVERASVTMGLRSGALQSISPELLPEAQHWALDNDVPMSIVGMDGVQGDYGNASIPYIPGQPFSYRVYFGTNAKEAHDNWKFGDNIGIGGALGFPACCIDFFDKYWRGDGWRDLTYPAMSTKEARNLIYNNVLLRHLGIRPIFHLPCSFNCKESCKIGIDIYDLMGSIGYRKEAEWSKELLSMPMEWTSLHGVAILVTPIFKIVYGTDPLPRKVVLHLLSDYYPDHGASARTFPFVNSKPIRLRRPNYNGFTSVNGMREGHNFVLSSLPQGIFGNVVDLGCGTGELLEAIHDRYPDTVMYGVDNQIDALEKAVEINGQYWLSDIFDWDWDNKFSIVLIAIQRFVEADREKITKLLKNIDEHAARLLIYSYDSWTHDIDDLLEKYFSIISTNKNSALNFEAILFESKNETPII